MQPLTSNAVAQDESEVEEEAHSPSEAQEKKGESEIVSDTIGLPSTARNSNANNYHSK